ncbi:MAG: hypothetical protein AAF371_13485 [Pseudomonadota bacterium]
MPAVPQPARALPGLLAGLAGIAADSRPDGAPAGAFRHACADGFLWLFPARLPADAVAVVTPGSAPPPRAAGSAAEAYWLAHAIRQEVWRTLRGRRGVLPVAAVALGPGPDGRRPVLAAALLGRRQKLPAGCLEPALDPAILARNARWAAGKAARRVTGCAY